MTPQARVQAAIEILDLVIASTRDNGPAADVIVADWARQHRFAGSKDKRAIREHVYAAIRAFGQRPESGRAAMAALLDSDPSLFDGSLYGPRPLLAREPRAFERLVPAWLEPLIPEPDRSALLERAPMDLRANRLKSSRKELLAAFTGADVIDGLPDGVRLAEPVPVEGHELWGAGAFEAQDAGSQWIVEACEAEPGMTVIDLCAGAGGKSLALAAKMRGSGCLLAADTNRDRLTRLKPRAERAGAEFIETRLLDPGRELEGLADFAGAADMVLVDAPCSGSGTWRRNPEGRWRLTPERLERVIALQAHILDITARLVRPGGTMVYAVCSLIAGEGREQVGRFLGRYPDWRADFLNLPVGTADEFGVRLSPACDGTDGFFFARLARGC